MMKKSGVRILAWILTAVLVFAELPVLKAKADDTIKTLALTLPGKPEAGMKVSELRNVTVTNTDKVTVGSYDVTWRKKDGEEWTLLEDTDVFYAGEEYRMEISLLPDYPYTFDLNALKGKITVNGSAQGVEIDPNSTWAVLFISRIFKADPAEITSVEILDLEKPAAGRVPDYTATTGSDLYFLTDENSAPSVTWSDTLDKHVLKETERFVAGRSYRVDLRLRVTAVNGNNQARFSDNPRLFVNGDAAMLVAKTKEILNLYIIYQCPDNGSGGEIEVDGLDPVYEYTGSAIKPEPEIYDGTRRLVQNVDYKLKYSNNVKPSVKKDAKLTITLKGNYSGTLTRYFRIESAPMSGEAAAKGFYTNEPVYGVANGKRQEIKPLICHGERMLKQNKDYTLEYPDNTEGAYATPGSWTIVVKGKGSYRGSYELEEVLVDPEAADLRDLATATVGANSMPMYVTDDPKDLSLFFEGEDALVEGTDYTLRYVGLGSVGKVDCIFTAVPGNGKYYGSKQFSYRIEKCPVDRMDVTLGEAVYMKGGVKPSVSVQVDGYMLREGEDYKLSYGANKDAAKPGTVKISGKGAYTGKRTVEFAITAKPLDAVTLAVGDVDAKSGANKVRYSVTDVNGKALKKNTDFTESITDNGDGTATLLLTAKGNNYTGTKSETFRIREGSTDIKKAKVQILNDEGTAVKDLEYTGNALYPQLKLTVGGTELILGDDYELLAYVNNVNKGNAVIFVAGRGGYTGLLSVKLKIRPKKV